MYCVNCGKEIQAEARFCPYCGASQQQAERQAPPQQEPGGQTPPQQTYSPAPSGGVPYELVLKAFTLICAAVFFIRFLFIGFSSLRNLFFLVQFFNLYNILTTLLLAVSALAGLWMVLVLVLTALRRTSSNTGSLFFGAAAGGALILVIYVLRILMTLIFFHHFPTQFLPYILGVLVCVGGLYGILCLMDEAPALNSLLQNAAGNFSAIFAAVSDGIKDIREKQASRAEAAPDSGCSAPDNGGYSAPGGAYGAPNNSYAAPGAQRVQTDRSLVMYILLSIVTCGIYSWYFIYSLARDVNIMCRDDGQKTGGLLAFILLSIVTCGIYALYWEYSLGNRLAANAPRFGLNFQENGTTVLLWYLVGAFLCGIGPYVAMYILIKNSNALGAAYNRSMGF